jgi:Ca-activated chloride channel homolog
VSFREPVLLLALALLPLAIAAYVLAQKRRKKFALRYTNIDVLAAVAGRSWGRHIPAALALLALAALLFSLSRPERTVAAPQRQGSVIMVTDTSGSMEATDVAPTRLAAAQAAARALAKKVPDEFNLGLVTFNNVAESIVAPTTDRDQIYAAIQGLKVHGSTAMGDGLKLGLQSARQQVKDTAGKARRVPAVLVLLSDGKSERGSEPVDVADQAKKLKIPIYTIALGTQSGVLHRPSGRSVPVPPDPVTLRDVAETTGGRFYAAPSAARLEDIYANLGTRFSTKKVKQEVTSSFAGAALALLLAACVLALLRMGRLP